MEFKSEDIIHEIRRLNRNDLTIFLIPVIIFSVYLAVFFPGIATIDSFNQLHQIASGQFTNWHPFFHTFIEMLCLKVYPHTVSVEILQILVFSAMWTVICKYNRNDNGKNKSTLKKQAIFSALICIIPINGLYSVTLWKDVLFSYLLMFLCFLAMVMINRKGEVDIKFIVLISLIMAFISQMRGNGLYVVVITVAAYSLYLFLKKNRKMSAMLVILTVTFLLVVSSLNIAYDVKDNEKDAVMAKVIHMLANYDMNLEMDDADRQTLHQLIQKDRVREFYIPTGSDSILSISNLHHYEKNKDTYISMAIKYSLKDPLHCLEYLFGSSPMVWNIVKGDWIGRPYYLSGEHDRLQSDFNLYYQKHNFTPHEPYENLSYANWGTPAFKGLNLLSLGIEGSPFDTVLNNPAFYMYLSIIILVLLNVLLKTREIYLMYLPNLLNIVMIFLSTPVQDYRYLYANLLVCYMLIIVLIGMDEPLKDKLKEFKSRWRAKNI